MTAPAFFDGTAGYGKRASATAGLFEQHTYERIYYGINLNRTGSDHAVFL